MMALRMRSSAISRIVCGGLSVRMSGAAVWVIGSILAAEIESSNGLLTCHHMVYHHTGNRNGEDAMPAVIRKTLIHVETTFIEGGRAAPQPLRLIAAAA